ncbi:MAG: chorismate mutase [Oscillospiraceae bacterium]|nr:chorismate mutase [Oscillospiraceae bacterium]MCD8100841.1 chorismate mutase [Oscillospiraceae bacterium]
MELQELRDKIDVIDAQLLPLFKERMALCKDIAAVKARDSLPVESKKREREILAAAMEDSGELEPYVHRFFTTLFEVSKAYQDKLCATGSKVRDRVELALAEKPGPFPQSGMIAVQGVEGAYSQLAAEHMFPRGTPVFFKTFEGVCDAVISGLCQYGILPIENSSNGSVRETYSLLQHKNVNIVRSTRLCIRHELMTRPDVKLEDITEIYSHEQAIGQCSEYLKTLGNRVKIIPCANTAAAAEKVAHSTAPIASISSHACGKLYGLVPVNSEIQNSDNNYTRFICISRKPVIYPGADRITLILATQHKPGALYEVLSKFAALEMNVIKLESCPIVGHDFEFMFFFEIQGNVTEGNVLPMLESLEHICERFYFLGNYSEV